MPVINGVYLKDFTALPDAVADANIIPIAISGNQVAYRTTVGGIVTDARVTGKLLTGLSVTGGAIASTDSILTAFGKVQNQLNSKVSSVGLTMPSAFSVANSPITSSGTLAVTANGLASQYIRGDGALADFPTGGGGGGSSVSYYLNGSVNQGTFGGNVYKEMNKTPVLGAGTDFSIGSDGYIAQFLTDANDPNVLLIPGGNFNLEFYFSASSSGGTPSYYVELYKYNGSTFSLIASNSATPELIAFGTTINPYFSSLAVPETVLLATDRLAIRIYVNHSGRTITLHTENSHLCQIITTFTTGLQSLNGLSEQAQYFAVGSTGTDFNIASSIDTHTFNIPSASASNRGLITTGTQTIAGAKTFQATATFNVTGNPSINAVNGDNLAISAESGTATAIQAISNSGRGIKAESTSNIAADLISNSGVGLSVTSLSNTIANFYGASFALKASISQAGNITANSFIKSGGTSSQFLKADGSIDSNFYALSSSLNNYLPTQGGTLTGPLIGTTASFASSIGLTSASSSSSLTSTTNGIEISVDGSTTSNKNTIFKVGSSETMRIDASGRLGIGTTTPAYPLSVYSTSNARISIDGTTNFSTFQVNNSGGSFYIGIDDSAGVNFTGTAYGRFLYSAGAYPMSFFTNGAERMRITSGGNVGIGTTSPAFKLDVNGGAESTYAKVSRDTGYILLGAGLNFSAIYARDNTDAQRPLYIEASNVLIGTETNSGYKLDVNGTGRFSGSVTAGGINTFLSGGLSSTSYALNASISSNASATSVAPVVRLSNNGGGYVTKLMFSDNNRGDAYITHVAGSAFTPSTRWLGFGVDAVDQMIINASGNVGIGTTSPAEKLDVNGKGRFADSVSIINNATTAAKFAFSNQSNASGSIGVLAASAGNTNVIYTSDLGGHIFETGTTTRISITSTGAATFTANINSFKSHEFKNTNNTSGNGVLVTDLGSNCNNTSSYHLIAGTGGADKFYLYGNGTYTTVSDSRLKKDISKVTDNYLEKVLALNIVNYHWNDQNENDALEFGMIAQEVEELIPSIVHEGREDENGNKYKGIQASVLPYILIKAIQEQQAQIEKLKALINK
jgi:hypothetical protein